MGLFGISGGGSGGKNISTSQAFNMSTFDDHQIYFSLKTTTGNWPVS